MKATTSEQVMAAGRHGPGWYLARLRVMGMAEIMHRLGEQAVLLGMQWRYTLGRAQTRHLPACAFCTSTQQQLPELPWNFDASASAVRDLLEGRVQAMNWRWQWQQGASSWHRAPDTGKRWPRGFFARLPYRPGNAYGDVRVAWEPSRLQQLVTLALLTGDADVATATRAVTVLETMFLDWVADNPALDGIHYISAMECALRLIACCHALDRVRARLTRPEQVWAALTKLVDEHARLIERRLSLHSSANNHLISEAAGLVYAGVLFPELSGAQRWRRAGLRILAAEAERQILADGGSAEQTFWYLWLVTDLYGIVVALLHHHNEPVSEAIEAAARRARDFLNTFADGPDAIPGIGDCDNGYALSPYLGLSWDRARPDGAHGLSVFETSGYTLMRDQDVRASMIFDHGPLGLAPTYVHGHADALSVELRCADEHILIDPGTCTYSGDIRWRNYFRGTRAHNTVTVDGRDQALQATRFMWSKPYKARLVSQQTAPDGRVLLLGCHDGYRDIDHVIHWRGIVIIPSLTLVVLDVVTGQGEHRVELNWHLGLDAAEHPDGSWRLAGSTRPVHILIEGAETRRFWADEQTPAGWYSPVYGARKPACTLRSAVTTGLPCELLTTIRIGESAVRQPVSVNHELDQLRARIYEARTD